MIINLTDEEHVAVRYAIRAGIKQADSDNNIGLMAALTGLARKIRL